MRIFIAIFLALLIINTYLYLFNENYSLSFGEFFQKIADMPKIDTSIIKLNFQSAITANWGAFNFLRDFINGLWQIVGVLLYICTQIANACIFLFQLIKTLFIGVLG